MSHDEQHLQQALTIWTAAFEHLSDGIVICDASDNILLINRALREIIGLNVDAPLPQHFSDLHLDGYNDAYGMPKSHTEARLYTIDERVLRCTRSPAMSGDEHVLGSVLVLRDITAEVTDRRSIVDFIATISHELRTPLTPIFIHLDMLLRGFSGSLNQEQTDMLQQVRRRTEGLNTIVRDIIIVASITAGTIECDPEPLSLQTVVQEVVLPRQARFIGKYIDLEIDVPSDIPQMFADHALTRIVLEHLLDNGYRSTLQGRVILHAQVDGEMIRVDVIDMGKSIPQETQIELFTSFFYVPDSGGERGSGLELFIVRELVELQGGRVWVESIPGQGSTFSFTLPQAAP